MPSLEKIRAIFDLIGSGQTQAFFENVDEDVDWTVKGELRYALRSSKKTFTCDFELSTCTSLPNISPFLQAHTAQSPGTTSPNRHFTMVHAPYHRHGPHRSSSSYKTSSTTGQTRQPWSSRLWMSNARTEWSLRMSMYGCVTSTTKTRSWRSMRLWIRKIKLPRMMLYARSN